MPHLSTEDRYTIQHMIEQGKSRKEICERINRDKSILTRELQRNALPDHSYSANFAERFAKERRAQKPKRNAMTPAVLAIVAQGLAQRFSPEQIIGDQAKQGNTAMPCVQTIYNHIKAVRKKGGQLHKNLRHRGKRRKPPRTGENTSHHHP